MSQNITKRKFLRYERVRKSGRFNMTMEASVASATAGLTLEDYLEIAENYTEYAKTWHEYFE